ncbi:hypothetical protein D3C81_2034130 [compost metagenome]
MTGLPSPATWRSVGTPLLSMRSVSSPYSASILLTCSASSLPTLIPRAGSFTVGIDTSLDNKSTTGLAGKLDCTVNAVVDGVEYYIHPH